MFIQACVAILILVGFESVTSMGEEAKNAKRDIPRAVLLSLAIQGAFCYLIEYFAANYFLNKGYTLTNAGASGAPLGDMMVIVGTWLFGSYSAGRAFMLVQAFTVFLALIGTTLSCINTGARVTYAMGQDEEVPAHFGMLHGKTQHAAPRRSGRSPSSRSSSGWSPSPSTSAARPRRRSTRSTTTSGTASASSTPTSSRSCRTRWSSSR